MRIKTLVQLEANEGIGLTSYLLCLQPDVYNGSWIAALLQFQSPVHLMTIITAITVFSNLKILRENFDIVLRVKGTEILMISTYPLIPKKILR